MTGPIVQAAMAQELFRGLFAGNNPHGEPLKLGEAITQAKAAVADNEARQTWILLGDPTMSLKLP
jgi:hypothetical protein